jgi:hypothetical protein
MDGFVEYMREGEVHEEFWCGDLMEKDQLGGLGVDGRIILK